MKITEIKAIQDLADCIGTDGCYFICLCTVAEKITGKTVVLKAKGGANGKLFGSVTAKEIAVVVSNQFNVKVDKRKITVDDIKAFGTYNAQVRLHAKVTASFKVQVVEE